jgi:hypothetical protein
MGAIRQGLPTIIEWRFYDFRAESADGIEFSGWRRVHNKHLAWHPGLSSRQRDSLSSIASAHSPNTTPPPFFG